MKIKNALIPLTFVALIFTACEDVPSNRLQGSYTPVSGGQSVGNGGSSAGNGSSGAAPGNGGLQGDTIQVEAKVEIRHLIEPKIDDQSPGGAYTRKLTIPKNYDGLLYLAGVNVSTLSSKNLKVRFRFGLDASPIDIPATVSTGAGLTPQTDVQVLVMDLRSAPFENLRLNYDLFDYNEYDFGAVSPDPGVLTEPTQYNRDEKLFCRGLDVQYDPTFTGSLSQGCVGSNDVCKFTYAKIVDKGLVRDGNPALAIYPTELSIAGEGLELDEDSTSMKLSRCLVDNPRLSAAYEYAFDAATKFTSVGESILIDGQSYSYQGPYEARNFSNWKIKGAALKGASGIFSDHYAVADATPMIIDSAAEASRGLSSKLFPLQTRFNLLRDVEYMGSDEPNGEKILRVMASNSQSLWMDGCNARVASQVNDFNGEHVGSCNVTATIEIVSLDDEGAEQIVDVTNEVKLQLVKPERLNTEGDNVLLSSFQSCNSTNQCGSGQCCINKRCWSKSIVSQCVEDMPTYGNGRPGDTCQSDNECSSFCCNQATGRCAVHDTLSDPAVLCSKPSGQTCIAKEWCMKHPVTQCFIVRTGFDPQGQQTCALRCYTYEKFGDCRASAGNVIGICIPPEQPEQPVFNPNDPNRCDQAIDPQDVPIDVN